MPSAISKYISSATLTITEMPDILSVVPAKAGIPRLSSHATGSRAVRFRKGFGLAVRFRKSVGLAVRFRKSVGLAVRFRKSVGWLSRGDGQFCDTCRLF